VTLEPAVQLLTLVVVNALSNARVLFHFKINSVQSTISVFSMDKPGVIYFGERPGWKFFAVLAMAILTLVYISITISKTDRLTATTYQTTE
jgi:hypothetical protein